ncbi:hypothetical protein B9J76_13680 [Lacticaseibacillus paracasei]|nr:hypothetical protein B9J76_13680 [Lacticaseibacillus paracasei]
MNAFQQESVAYKGMQKDSLIFQKNTINFPPIRLALHQ